MQEGACEFHVSHVKQRVELGGNEFLRLAAPLEQVGAWSPTHLVAAQRAQIDGQGATLPVHPAEQEVPQAKGQWTVL